MEKAFTRCSHPAQARHQPRGQNQSAGKLDSDGDQDDAPNQSHHIGKTKIGD